jgi:hypothetical protein
MLDVDYYTDAEYFAATKKACPAFTPIWTQQSLHEITKVPQGKIAELSALCW